MPRRILLISANRCTTPDPVFPLGLAYLNAALRQAGHQSFWLDRLGTQNGIEAVLQRYRPDLVGVSLRNIDDVLIRKRETFFGEVASLSARLHQEAHCPIVVGGSGFSLFPDRLLDVTGADFGVCGQGERTLVDLVAALEDGADFSTLPGLVFRQNGKVKVNAPAAGLPGQELVESDRPAEIAGYYLQAGGALNLQTQRGCPFRCCYCTYPLLEGSQPRRRPAAQVAEEFALLQRQGARYVFIVDSIFNSSPRHVEETCEALLRRQVRLPWGCFLRPQGLTPELMRLMARAGLAHVEFGSDSFCDEVLNAYQKDFTFDDILRSNELARLESIDCCHFLICGGPGETSETLQQGFANSRHLANAVIMAVVGMRIYPGTSLYQRALREGCVKPEADLLNPAYYLAPGVTAEGTFAQLEEFCRLSPSWIVGDPAPAYRRLVERLRQRGVVGPLWSYFSHLQRLWPRGSVSAVLP